MNLLKDTLFLPIEFQRLWGKEIKQQNSNKERKLEILDTSYKI